MSMKDFVDTLNDEQRKALLSALGVKSEVENVEEHDSAANDFTMNQSLKSSEKKRGPVKASNNMWTDSGEDRHIKTPETKKTPRNRPPPAIKTVACNACGRSYKINASLIHGEYYRCERCVR